MNKKIYKVKALNIPLAATLISGFMCQGQLQAMSSEGIAHLHPTKVMAMSISASANNHTSIPSRNNLHKTGILDPVDVQVSGKVTDESGTGLPGVNVLVKGTATGTTTSSDGSFTLTAPDGNATLVFSYIGYVTQEVPINNRTTLNISLVPDVQSLSEVVVVGYQTQKRSDIVGAVGVVDTEEIKKVQAGSVGELLQGRAAGVTVTSSGAPGQASAVKIRGTNSISGQDSPLYVIDGMFINGAFPDFNPNDVESIQVLKDAAATALYGSRGMNGVVIITTKRGKQGTPSISYNTYVGAQSVPKRLPLMNAAQFREAITLAYANNGEPAPPLSENVDTDWQDAMFKTGLITDHNLTVSGGGENASYLVSGNFFFQDGTIKGPSFRRYQVRVNTDMKKGRVRIGENLMLSRNLTTNVNGLPFLDVLQMFPTIPVYDPTTRSGFGYGRGNLNNTFATNPVGLQEHYSNKTTSAKVFGSAFAEVTIFDFLTYKLNMGLDYSQASTKYFERIGALRQNNPDGGPAFVDDRVGEFFNILVENTLNFNKTFGQHAISALVGYTQQKDNYKEVFAHTEGINGEYWVQNNGTTSPRTGGFMNQRTLASWLGSINYTFADKYLFQVNARRDGSSIFGQGNQYGVFPSASVGWRVSKEGFMEAVPFISDLKLRASYGEVGSQAIGILDNFANGPYRISPTIDYNQNYVFNNGIALGAINRQLVNPNIRWERKTTTNVGMDVGLWENRILFSADYFISRTKDLLLEVPIPLTAGSTGANPIDNLASIQNKGVEFALTYQNQAGEFKYSASANVTSIRNKVLGLIPANNNQPIYGNLQLIRLAVDEPISFYALKTDGVYQNQAEVDASGIPGVTPGDLRFVDTNGDKVINLDDRQRVGSPFPTLEYGLNLTGSYMGFDLTAFFAGVGGNKIFNEGRWWNGRSDDNFNYRSDEPFWTGEGTSNTVPKPKHGGSGLNAVVQSDRWIEKGDYLRMKTIQLGYSLPTSFVQNLKVLSNLRVYLSGQNVFTITKYKGYDPEVTGAFGRTSNLDRGQDIGNFPAPRILSAGIQAGF
jgi:TonB-linked SusC/RagA family outer membrane protein